MSFNATLPSPTLPDSMSSPSVVSIAVASTAFALFLFRLWDKSKGLPLPPGPRPLPVLGNVLQLPTANEWAVYADWSKKYGSDIILLRAFSSPIIVLNSYQACIDLLTKRWPTYSDRPSFTMTNELMGWKGSLAPSQFGEGHKVLRRLLSIGLNTTATRSYWPLFERESSMFLRRVLEHPEDTLEHTRISSAALALALNYGYHITSDNDPVINLATEALAGQYVPGKYLVDFFPILRYVPSWFPGAKFKRDAVKWDRLRHDFHEIPVEMVKNNMEKGTALPCYTRTVIEAVDDIEDEKQKDYQIKMSAGSVFSGSVHTLMCAIQTCILAMVLFPDAQAKAHEELDRVVGRKRLPNLADMEDLPYINAIVREALRWGPPAPLCVPHATYQEDEYNGMRIPAGSIVIPNLWKILHDPAIFKEPFKFSPERYLPDPVTGELNPDMANFPSAKLVFGFGRRVCPGMQIGLTQFNIYVARTLACFNIDFARDANGNKITPVAEWTSGLTSHPHDFKAKITPRSPEHAELIVQDSSQYLKGEIPWFVQTQKKQ